MMDRDRVLLACEAAQIRILKYEPGKVLKVRCGMHWAGKALLAVFSLAFFAFGAGFLSSYLVFLGGWVEPVCGMSALALWAKYSLQGAWVSFNLQDGGYTFRTIVQSSTASSWPKFEIKSKRTGCNWEAVLLCDGQRLGRPRKDSDRRVAEAVFIEFTSLFATQYLVLEQMRKAAQIQIDGILEEPVADDSCESPRAPSEPPLIFLIHGSFVQNAPWTREESSDLVAGIKNAEINAEFVRFPWTGRNSASARRRAAEELAGTIAPVLEAGTREVVLVGHSHGGNIALQAAMHLKREQRMLLKFCCLATPFLGVNRRFDAWEYFEGLPEAIRDNLHIAIVASVMAISALLFFALQDQFLPTSLHVAVGTQGGRYSIIPMLVWILLVPWLTIKLMERIVAPTLEKATTGRQEVSTSNNTLICAYSHDEAYMALSVVSNAMALVQIGIFKLLDGTVFIFRKTRVFEIVYGISRLLIWLGIVLSVFSYAVAKLATMIIPKEFFGERSIDLSSIALDPNILPISWLLLAMLAALLLVGLAVIACVGVILIFGVTRLAIFRIIGVADQIVTRRT